MTAAPPEHEKLLREAVSCGASDILITAGQPVMVTMGGILRALPGRAALGAEDTRRLAEGFLTPELAQRFVQELELDTRYPLDGVGNFRVNLFMQRGRWGAAIRVVPVRIPMPDEIGLEPDVVSRILEFRRGLVLITGPTGAGKSTTIASLLEQVNQGEVRRHIVTVEDPIEFVFEAKNGVFDQREVPTDTRSYARGLRGALRQLPHIIFVGEMRDLESVAIALTAAETGNLVISTMATQSAAQTVTRIIDSFPPHQQAQIRAQVALSLRAVVAQVLFPRADGKGRVAAREIMFVNQAIQNLIREEKVHQITNVISTSPRENMVTLEDSLMELVEQGVVAGEMASPYIDDPEKRALLLRRKPRVVPLPQLAARGA